MAEEEKNKDEDKQEDKQEDKKANETKQDASKKEELKIPENLKDIVQKIEDLKVKDLAELVKILEEKFGVSAQIPAMAAVSAAGGEGSNGGVEEKSEFNIELKSAGGSKIAVIKLVKEVTGKGLKDSKDLVDATEKSPQVIKEQVKKEEAEEIKSKFEGVGAEVELK